MTFDLKRIVAIIALVALVGYGVWHVSRPYLAAPDPIVRSGQRTPKNALRVFGQTASSRLRIDVAAPVEPGFVTVHEDVSGVPGEIVGVSGLLPEGETRDILILPNRAVRAGWYWAVLRLDDGDGAYAPARDRQARDEAGSFISARFRVSAE